MPKNVFELSADEILAAIKNNPGLFEKDVGYYNKEIIKIKQRNNKDIAKEKFVATPLSFGQEPLAPKDNHEVVVRPSEKEELPDSSSQQDQAPTSPPAHITSKHIKRAVIQFYHNQGQTKLQERKLKIRLNCDFGDGQEENVEFIATLTNDLGNFKKFHPEASREHIHAWAMASRRDIKKHYEVNAYMGKFHMNNGWRSGRSQVNQIEPWTGALLWYDKISRTYHCLVKLYQWEEIFELTDETITDRQRKTNVRAQKLWYNPEHNNLIRPLTWAQRRGLE